MEGEHDGSFVFGAVKAWLDVRYGARDGSAGAEFFWEGINDADPACGRGWAAIGTAGRFVGQLLSTTATTQGSSPSGSDFFNSLLDHNGLCAEGWFELPVRLRPLT